MKHLTILKFFLLSLGAALIFSALAFVIMRMVNESTTAAHRQELGLNIAREIESKSLKESLSDYELFHATSHGDIRTPIWVINEEGKLLGMAAKHRLPPRWADMDLPEEVHEISLKYALFALAPEAMSIRLTDDGDVERYLILQLSVKKNISLLWSTPFLLIFIMVSVAVFFALTLTFFYLQSKSKEARHILNRLKQGDLQARFPIQRFDEIGSLMLDFNLMANEIEGLVSKLRTVEKSRRTLLQELSHDLRTPLTSLTTSFETLESHFNEMPTEDRAKFFRMIEGDLEYFSKLLEDLFFISDLDDPSVSGHIKTLSLDKLLRTEVESRAIGLKNLNWKFTNLISTENKMNDALFDGDEHLMERLLKNAFDNAERFASSQVEVSIQSEAQFWKLSVVDNGPGISKEEIENFGTRRSRRRLINEKSMHFSLGLGSVIMKSIVELHQGYLEIQNKSGGAGTELNFYIPKSKNGLKN